MPANILSQLRGNAPLPANKPVAQAKRHEVLGLLTLALTVLLSLSLASFDIRGGRDWVGPTGARVAELLVALLGSASVLLPWSLLVLSVQLFRRSFNPLRPWHDRKSTRLNSSHL